eukprot:CAMPEP_0195292718 /NCGR_PEP_ID=MMETSP0707-20130614/10694_1 /TAXON_ID=33640 /ORGANISM="Asterionellopsis glacialis, Strain CCMP134" /LENGTH=470 /DNA_ID=CAMNT_0040353257 /DNA_START=41 /DNA_END=1453 /DNA_ORIENTATION=-
MLQAQAYRSAVFLVTILFLAVTDSYQALLEDENDNKDEKWTVSWNAPFLARSSGYGSEATSFVLGLNATLPKHWDIALGLSHGDSIDWDLVYTLPEDMVDFLEQGSIAQSQLRPDRTIVICHAEPGAWSVPSPRYESGSPCPPPTNDGKEWHAVIGRTMFETDRLPNGWEERLNAVSEVWVPTHHHKEIFLKGGVTKPIVVVGQGIDSSITWNPSRVGPLDWALVDPEGQCSKNDYKFLSVFKWEDRKGHDILLKAFFNVFSEPDSKACLVIVTSLYHDDATQVISDMERYWVEATKGKYGEFSRKRTGKVILLSGLPTVDLVRLYKTVDACVLPSRGEGWGRPYMEAMSMGLPTIATNWSGPTEFVTDENGYLLPITGLVDANLDAFPGHKWAEPDGDALEKIMVNMRDDPEKTMQKGSRARKDVLELWSNSAMALVVSEQLERLATSGRTANDNVLRQGSELLGREEL